MGNTRHAPFSRRGTADHWLPHRASTLLWWNMAVLISLVIHDLDHLRQAANVDYSIPLRLYLGNAAVYVPTFVAVYFAWRRDRRVRGWTALSAALWLIGFIGVHLVGAGSYFGYWATPYPRLGVDAMSWALFVIPVVVFTTTIAVALQPLATPTNRASLTASRVRPAGLTNQNADSEVGSSSRSDHR